MAKKKKPKSLQKPILIGLIIMAIMAAIAILLKPDLISLLVQRTPEAYLVTGKKTQKVNWEAANGQYAFCWHFRGGEVTLYPNVAGDEGCCDLSKSATDSQGNVYYVYINSKSCSPKTCIGHVRVGTRDGDVKLVTKGKK